MNIASLETILREKGINLTARLTVEAPADTVTPEIRQALAEHKAMLLHRLALRSWGVLSRQRWGNQEADPTPDINITRPNRARMYLAMMMQHQGKPEAIAPPGVEPEPEPADMEVPSSC